MEAQPSLFAYPALDDTFGGTRLLRLLPAETDGPAERDHIRCDLFPVASLQNHSFIALSYEWGHAEGGRSILVNGCDFAIRPNLWHFLNELKNTVTSEEPLVIWADAICINQADEQEKAAQVRMMDLIYSSAEKVYVWLGQCHDPYVGMAFDRLNTWAASDQNYRSLRSGDKKYWGGPDAEENIYSRLFRTVDTRIFEEHESGNVWSSLVDLCQKTYWQRAWIIQELLLANSVCLWLGPYRLSHRCIPLLSLIMYDEAYFIDRLSDAAPGQSSGPTEQPATLPPPRQTQRGANDPMGAYPPFSYPGFSLLHRRWEAYRDFAPAPDREKLAKRYIDPNYIRGLHLAPLIRTTLFSQCYDPHDRIYALLGLDHRFQEKRDFAIDYSTPLVVLAATTLVYCASSKSRNSENTAVLNFGRVILQALSILPPTSSKSDGKELCTSVRQHAQDLNMHLSEAVRSCPLEVSLDMLGTVTAGLPANEEHDTRTVTVQEEDRKISWTLVAGHLPKPGDVAFALQGTSVRIFFKRNLFGLLTSFVGAAIDNSSCQPEHFQAYRDVSFISNALSQIRLSETLITKGTIYKPVPGATIRIRDTNVSALTLFAVLLAEPVFPNERWATQVLPKAITVSFRQKR